MIGTRLQRVWYGDEAPGAMLRGLEQVYARLRAWDQRRQLAARAPDLVDRPIIVVGNLTVGGTGKTPLVIRLCELLVAAGQTVGVVSRGHGRRGRGPVEVSAQSDPAESGDEPLLIATRCGVPVRVDEDREAAARALFEQGVEVVLADDGLQRERLPRALELCVVDAARGFGNGHLLPAGPLREPMARVGEVDWVICQGEGVVNCLPADAIRMQLVPGDFRSLDGGKRMTAQEMTGHLKGRASQAVAGIGHPRRFFNTLRQLGLAVDAERVFPDHHAYSPSDFAGVTGTVLMTEKDAVKCRRLGLAGAWYLPVSAQLPADFEQAFVVRVSALLEN